MKKNIYSIYDKLTNYININLDDNDNTAKRNFGYAINQSNSNINYKPQDFDLYCLGTFDTENGEIILEKRHVANGLDLKD